ncbi:MAG: peptidoglycan D,D-transpeptidase FtsI family protein [Rhodomicrobium sp.]
MRTLAGALQRIGGSPGPDHALRNARRAQLLLGLYFAACFAAVSGKAIHYAVDAGEMPSLAAAGAPPALARSRPDIVDRNGRLLATDVKMYWLAATGKEIPHADDAAEKLASLFTVPDQATLARRFRNKPARFEWVKRGLTPNDANAVQALGIPGLTLFATVGRAYPQHKDGAQILGITGADNEGRSGIERYADREMAAQLTPASNAKRPIVMLSLDIGVQHVLAEELDQAMQRYRAEAALGLVLDVRNGEVLASVSLPDFDPNSLAQASDTRRRNRIVTDVYELGSVFKTFTIAMALDQGVAGRYDIFDTSPLTVGHMQITDPHAHGPATLEDVFIHSSNTGTARIAALAGVERQRRFLESLGLFEELQTEAGSSPNTVFEGNWGIAKATTVSYGYGIAVPPLVFASAMASIVNGGYRIKPTFLISQGATAGNAEKVIQPETSALMRELMRQVVARGTGRRAAVAGLDIGGKTGTARKIIGRHYSHEHVVNSFVAVLPVSEPKYLLLVTLDGPKSDNPEKPADAGLNAAPTAGAIVKRIAPMLDVLPRPRFDETASTPYEQTGSNSPQRAVLRKTPYETSGFDPGYPAYSQREPAAAPGYLGHYGR